MTPDPITLGPGATLAAALELFADERVGAVPVVDEVERVVGIASYLDLLGYLRVREAREAAAAPPSRGAPPPVPPPAGAPGKSRKRGGKGRPSRRATPGAIRRRAPRRRAR
jgi:CBS domain-containing protein